MLLERNASVDTFHLKGFYWFFLDQTSFFGYPWMRNACLLLVIVHADAGYAKVPLWQERERKPVTG